MSRDGLSKPLVTLGLVLSMVGALWAGLACGGQATITAAASSSTQLGPTTSTALDATTEATDPGASDQKVQELVDQLREAARRTSFTVYYLGTAYRTAQIAGVMSGNADSSGAPRLVDVVYRHTGHQDRLVVYLSQYDPTQRPDLEKPFPEWTLIREVEAHGYKDAIYRSGEPADALFYVARRGSTEISVTGYVSGGYLTEEQLVDIASLLVPAA
jgi:hypothetical protein